MLFLLDVLVFALLPAAVFWLIPPVRRAEPLRPSRRRVMVLNAVVGVPVSAVGTLAMSSFSDSLPLSIQFNYLGLVSAAPVVTGLGLALGWALLRLRFGVAGLLASIAWAWFFAAEILVMLVLVVIYPLA